MDWTKFRQSISEKNGDGVKVFNRIYNKASVKIEQEKEPEQVNVDSPKSESPVENKTISWDELQSLVDSNNPTPDVSTPTSTQSVQAASVNTSSSDRMKTAINYLIGKGLTKEGAAGVAGVLFAESGLNPGKLNEDEDKKYDGKAGKGIAQWSNNRRLAYNAYMKDKSGSLEDELDYLYQELES